MSTEGSGSPPKAGDAKDAREKPQGNRARQLFGHKGGGSPWEGEDRRQSSAETPTAAAQPDTSSAPYPREAAYARDDIDPAKSNIFSDVDDDGELTKLHPNYKLLMRVGAVILGLIIAAGAIVFDELLNDQLGTPIGILTGIGVLFALFLIIRVPTARYNARGYQISHDRLRVVRGIMWHSDTIVPFGRVQHIDVDQGPIERALSIATMTLHTAGSHNASVRLPGLGHELAVEMREAIREHIKRESM